MGRITEVEKGHSTWLLKDREELTHQTKKRKVLQVEGPPWAKAWPCEVFRGLEQP